MDLGTDAAVGAQFAKEHALVMQLITQGSSAPLPAARDAAALLKLPLSGLRNVMCTPHALSMSGISLRRMAATWGLQELVAWGFTYRHMLAAGLNHTDLGSFDYDLCVAMGVGARDVLELRPQASHVAAMNLSDAEFIELGMGSKEFMSAVGYNYRSMREHRFTLSQWSHILGDEPDWASLGFRDFDECAAVWDADELFTHVFAK